MRIIKEFRRLLLSLSLLVGIWIFAAVPTHAQAQFADASENSTGGFVTRMYDVALGRTPDEEGYADWVQKLNSGEKSASDIIYGFFFSKEYTDKQKSNEEIVTDFYHAMLSREPDAAGLADWVEHLNIGMTMQSINYGFVESDEFKNICAYYGINNGTVTLSDPRDYSYGRSYFVYRLYKNCLDRTPDVEGYQRWCQYLADGNSGAQCAYGFIFSEEFWKHYYDNSAYVDVLYRTILGREADANGKAQWVEALDYTNTREHVLNGFLFSPEFTQQCTEAGISVGDAIPEPEADFPWQYNVRILAECNRQRQANGVERMLTTREDFWRDVAMVRAAETTKYFAHSRLDDRSYWTAFQESGFGNCGCCGENIAYIWPTSPEFVVTDMWMQSPGHRGNILEASYENMATGVAIGDDGAYYYAQEFYTDINSPLIR